MGCFLMDMEILNYAGSLPSLPIITLESFGLLWNGVKGC